LFLQMTGVGDSIPLKYYVIFWILMQKDNLKYYVIFWILMQINVGSLTGSTPKFLLHHLEPSTRKNWPNAHVTDAHYTRMDLLYMHSIRERTNYELIIEVLCIVWELDPIGV
jgi:hypothetical protein